MPSPFLWILSLLAVYGMAHMIAYEDGPFDMFAGMRERAGQSTWIGRGFHCVLCLGFWLSIAWGAWLIFINAVAASPYGIVTILSLSGGVRVLHRLLYGGGS